MAKKKHGNTKFSIELFEKICDAISCSKKGLHFHCKANIITAKSFYQWISEDDKKEENRLGLSDIYVRAREIQSEYLSDLMLEVSFDDGDDEKPFVGANHIQRDRLKMDALKITSARLNPKKYSDKIDVTSKGNELKSTTVITGMNIKNTKPNEDKIE